ARRLALAALLLLALAAAACGADPAQPRARQARAGLDAELAHAVWLGVPTSALAPVRAGERKAAASASDWGYSWSGAADRYTVLTAQLIQIEQASHDALLRSAGRAIQDFSALVNARRGDGFVEVPGYATRLEQARQMLADARSVDQIAAVTHYATGQAQALAAMPTVYGQLHAFQAAMTALKPLGLTVDWTSAAYDQDLADFRAATGEPEMTMLARQLNAQLNQLAADNVQAGPYVAGAVLKQMQADITQLATYGEPAGALQTTYAADARAVAAARTPADYLALLTTLADHRQQIAIPLARGRARADIATLQALVDQTTAKYGILQDYEYADSATGIGDVRQWFYEAPLQNYANPTCDWDVACRYDQVDAEATQMTTNLRAMVANLSDKTARTQPHQTDLQLMTGYGFMTGQVTVVSLREQVARAYQDGKLVYTSDVTTGRETLPTPPGVLYTMSRQREVTFLPLGPIGPANGYPTLIHYAVNFTSPTWQQFQGYYLHDAWWRLRFGVGSNLPHYDPAAFNNGSHGCINFPEASMPGYYDWVRVGTPVIVY
ncbi:MAG TPA: L,D-transpeptidase, partial [Ktedonobacterales bacterium]